MTTKELIEITLWYLVLSSGIAIVRSIFIHQEKSAWEKFVHIFGSALFATIVGILITTNERVGWIHKNVDYIVAFCSLTADVTVNIIVKRGPQFLWNLFVSQVTKLGEKHKEDDN